MTTFRELCLSLVLIALVVVLFLLAITIGENRWYLHAASANLSAASWNLRAASQRIADLVGDVEVRDRKPQTVATIVAAVPPVLRTADETIAAGQPLLREATARVREGKATTDAAHELVVDLRGAVQEVRESLMHADADIQAFYPAIKNLDAVVLSAQPALANAGKITAQVADAAPLYLDCDHNPSCFYNLSQGTAKAAERMAQAWEKSAPATAKAVQQTTEHAAELSKPGWFTRLFKRIF